MGRPYANVFPEPLIQNPISQHSGHDSKDLGLQSLLLQRRPGLPLQLAMLLIEWGSETCTALHVMIAGVEGGESRSANLVKEFVLDIIIRLERVRP
jgi:hypothetical protein